MEEQAKPHKNLELESDDQLRSDLGFNEVPAEVPQDNLEKQVEDYVYKLLSQDVSELEKRQTVDGMGAETQVEVTNLSKMLETPIRKLSAAGEDGGPVAKSLVDLKDQVESLDPTRFDLTSAAGFMESVARALPFIGSKLSRYFARYMSAEEVIDRIMVSLQTGRDELNRDNVTLSQDKERMLGGLEKLRSSIQLGQLLDEKLQYKVDRDLANDEEKAAFVQNELLFALRQRVLDLQQTVQVVQQGVLTTELIIRNNRELIRGVDRARTVTISALQVAVACAAALANQKIVLKKIEALNKTTSNLIAHNAAMLKNQGADIQKKASEATIDIQSLERAFQDVKAALTDVATYRQNALPRMAQNIQRMQALNEEAYKAVEQLESGNSSK
ncbi:toxic anion resistance protein [bacterium SCSIO 12741]|nr:toxic anion resistance protein [bacterium SCSIO 12741]